MRLDAGEYLLTLGNYLVVGTLLTLLGFVVYFLRPDAPAARAMLVRRPDLGPLPGHRGRHLRPGWFRPLCACCCRRSGR